MNKELELLQAMTNSLRNFGEGVKQNLQEAHTETERKMILRAYKNAVISCVEEWL